MNSRNNVGVYICNTINSSIFMFRNLHHQYRYVEEHDQLTCLHIDLDVVLCIL